MNQKKGKLKKLIVVVLLIALCLAACTHIYTEKKNEAPKAAYEKVLNEYRKAKSMGYKGYVESADEFNYVSEKALTYASAYGAEGFDMETGPDRLFYAYYDLNGDGIYELLIGATYEGEFFSVEDIFIYENGEAESVYPGEWKEYKDYSAVKEKYEAVSEELSAFEIVVDSPIYVYAGNKICVELNEIGTVNTVKKSWYKLNKDGSGLEKTWELAYCFSGDITTTDIDDIVAYEDGKEITYEDCCEKMRNPNHNSWPLDKTWWLSPARFKPI